MPTLSYKIQGRFGNNLIQYCIAKLLCKLFGHTLITRNERGSVVLTDFEWKQLAPSLVEHQNNPEFFRSHPYRRQNLRLDGFFQDSKYLVPFRTYFQSLLNKENPDKINESISIRDIVSALEATPIFEEIIVHLRMDDFQGAGKDHSSVILHPNYFHSFLPELQKSTQLPVRIVFDRKNVEKESRYIQTFLQYSPMFQSSDLLLDFATLVKARVLVASNSTFAWIAAFFAAEKQQRILPTIHHMGNQNLGKIEDSDEIKESFFITW